MEMPLTAHPPHKRSFIPSLWEKKRVGRLVDLIKQGKLKPLKPLKDPFADDAEEEDMFYPLWKPEDEVSERGSSPSSVLLIHLCKPHICL
jgi:ribosome biogenesis protein ERB1